MLEQNANESEFSTDKWSADHEPRDHERLFGDFARAPEGDPGDCVAHISRGIARYHRGEPECEGHYLVAFSLNAPLAASEVVGRLEDDIRDDVADVLLHCRKRLRNDPQDVVARTRLGLTLLLLYQDADAFCDLQQVFLQSPAWRPFLRLLVNEAKWWRATRPSHFTQSD
jgi:hypothetical protein